MLGLIKPTEFASILIVRYGLSFLISTKKIESWAPDKAAGAYILVANHSAAFDPFLITSNLNWNQIRAIFPFFFMTHNRFFRFWPLRLWLYLHGCFPAFEHHSLEYGLGRAMALLSQNHTLLMFPEGKVADTDRAVPPKSGIETLANVPNVQLVPVRVRWERKRGLLKSYSLSVGKPFSGKNMTAEQIMDVVYSLKFS